jgi:ABC-2 type transport system permease protein
MTTQITERITPDTITSAPDTRVQTMPFLQQLLMLVRRSLLVTLRDPAWILPSILGVFFLLIYEGSLSGAAAFFLPGQSYLGFIVPLSVISTALSGSGAAGEAINRDSTAGYFDKLLLTPVSRVALLLAPMITAALMLVFQACIVLAVAVLMGLRPVTGLPGVVVLLGLAMLLSVALGGFVVGVALRTNSTAAVNGASFLVFPLTFLTSTFTPLELLTGWVRTAAQINPITYILEASREVINVGWNPTALGQTVAVLLLLNLITFTFAFTGLRTRTCRR